MNNKKLLSSSQKLKNTINAKKLLDQEGQKTSTESIQKSMKQQQQQHQQQKSIPPLDNDTPSPKANAFFILGVFPILATGTLVYFNDEMREDFMNKFGIQSKD